MAKEFVTYELALRMKQLGFDEECFYVKPLNGNTEFFYTPSDYDDFAEQKELEVGIPLFQQAFRWFRENYDLCIVIKPIDDKNLELGYNLLKNGLMMGSYLTYEEAELACLQKLIEIVKTK